MNNTITSRIELLLAKIAGHDVDLKTMTPGVATNLSEKFMLEIADRLDNMGGGSEPAETEIAEYELGEGREIGNALLYEQAIDPPPSIPQSDVYLKANGEEFPLSSTDSGDYVYAAMYNYDGQEAIDPNEPYFIVTIEERTGYGHDVQPGLLGGADTTSYILSILTSENLDSETIELVHKSSSPAGGSGEFIIHCDLGIGDDDGLYVDNPQESFAEVNEAFAAGKELRVEASLDDHGMAVNAELQLIYAMPGSVYAFGTIFPGDELTFVLAQYIMGESDSEGEMESSIFYLQDEGEINIVHTSVSTNVSETPVSLTIDEKGSEIRNYAGSLYSKTVSLYVYFTNGQHGHYLSMPLQEIKRVSDNNTALLQLSFVGFDVETNEKYTAIITCSDESGDAVTGTIVKSKSEYVFDFTIAEDQQNPGSYIATPGSGVTYAAIANALAKTNNVFFHGYTENDEVLHAIVSVDDQTSGGTKFFGAGGHFISSTNAFVLYNINVYEDDSCTVVLKTVT